MSKSKKGWLKNAPKPSLEERRSQELEGHRKKVQELTDIRDKLLAQVASLEKKKDNLAKTIREECRSELHRISQIQVTLSENQAELNRLLEQNKMINKNLIQEKKRISELQENARRAKQTAEEQRKKYLVQLAKNDQELAGGRQGIANEKAALNDRKYELNQREFRISNKEKELLNREIRMRKDEAIASSKTREAEELQKDVKVAINKMTKEAETIKAKALSLKKEANNLMSETNKKMSDALKKEEVNNKDRAVFKERDKNLDKLKAELNEKQISQEEYERYLGLLKREVDKKITILKKLRKENKK